jgi:hypothetical protein
VIVSVVGLLMAAPGAQAAVGGLLGSASGSTAQTVLSTLPSIAGGAGGVSAAATVPPILAGALGSEGVSVAVDTPAASVGISSSAGDLHVSVSAGGPAGVGGAAAAGGGGSDGGEHGSGAGSGGSGGAGSGGASSSSGDSSSSDVDGSDGGSQAEASTGAAALSGAARLLAGGQTKRPAGVRIDGQTSGYGVGGGGGSAAARGSGSSRATGAAGAVVLRSSPTEPAPTATGRRASDLPGIPLLEPGFDPETGPLATLRAMSLATISRAGDSRPLVTVTIMLGSLLLALLVAGFFGSRGGRPAARRRARR